VMANDGSNDLSITAVQLSDTALAEVYGIAANGEGPASFDTVTAIINSLTYVG
jgi:hypothetical protein